MAVAALLLPFDIGVRRIAVSFRKLLGIGRRELAAVSLERSGRMVQLMQAKSRSVEMQEPVSLFDRATPIRPYMGDRRLNAAEAPVRAAPTEPTPEGESEAQPIATAAELLRRRRTAAKPPPAKIKDDD